MLDEFQWPIDEHDILGQTQMTDKQLVPDEGQRSPQDKGQEEVDVNRIALALEPSGLKRL